MTRLIRSLSLPKDSVVYASKTKRQVCDRSGGALDRVLAEESAL